MILSLLIQIAITHSNGADKDSVYFDWTAPANGSGPLRFGYRSYNYYLDYVANRQSLCINNYLELLLSIEVVNQQTTANYSI